jgi:hypothetical protein
MDITAQVRLRIQDRWRYAVDDITGSWADTAYKLAQGAPFSTITGATAYRRNAMGYSVTGATFDLVNGVVSFAEPVGVGGVCRASYQWAVFGDDAIGQFISDGGSMAGASQEAIRVLMFDAAKRARWAAPDGSQYDDTAALRHLQTMYDVFQNEQSEIGEGDITSWATI